MMTVLFGLIILLGATLSLLLAEEISAVCHARKL